MWWAGNGKMTWLIDFEGYALKNAPSLKARLTRTQSGTQYVITSQVVLATGLFEII